MITRILTNHPSPTVKAHVWPQFNSKYLFALKSKKCTDPPPVPIVKTSSLNETDLTPVK